MSFLPIVERELRVASRSGKTYWTRVTTAFAVAVVGAWFIYSMRFMRGFSSGGKEIFMILAGIGFYGNVFAGVVQSADSISRENREGTLGLLFLTDLKGYDVVLGKLAAGALISFYSLLATFPVLALPMMLGGVTWFTFVGTMLTLLNGLFFAHAVALLVSTGHREAQQSISMASIFMLFLVFGLPALQLIPTRPEITLLLRNLALFSPANAFAQIAMGKTAPFWRSLLCSHVLAWAFLLWASRIATHCWKVKSVSTLGWKERAQQWVLGNSEFRLAMRRRLLDRSAYFWLISRGRFRKLSAWLGCLLAAGAVITIYLLNTGGTRIPGKMEFLILMLILHLCLKITMSLESSRHLDAQRRNGELELLLSATPLRNEDIFHAHWLAFKRLLMGPLIFVLCLDLLMLVLGCLQKDGAFFKISAEVAYFFAFSFSIGMLLFDLWSLRWISLWMGLSSKRPGHATGAGVVSIYAVPIVVCYVGLILCSMMFRPTGGLTFFFYFGGWIIICVLNNWAFVAWAKMKLRTDLRVYALTFDEDRLTFLGRLGRALGQLVHSSSKR